MNVTMFGTAQNKGGAVFAGNLSVMQRAGLKSTQEKVERQQKAAGQIAFWENQKEGLKNMECETLKDIVKKLEMFHSYEDEIAAVKKQYNQEQMRHTMDEAEEIGEKIADEAEKNEPKTAEERREDMVEEALGTEEDKSELEESLEEIEEKIEEEISESVEETLNRTVEESVDAVEDANEEENSVESGALFLEQMMDYKRIDVKV